jgi:hypothetical protein
MVKRITFHQKSISFQNRELKGIIYFDLDSYSDNNLNVESKMRNEKIGYSFSNNVISKSNLSKRFDSSIEAISFKVDHKNEILCLNQSKINENHKQKGKCKDKSVIELETYKDKVFRDLEILKKRKGGKLKINYCNLITLIVCPCFNKKYQSIRILLKMSKEVVSKQLNFLDIIKMLQEFSKLKLTLMNRDQINIFSFGSKPIISSYENLIDTFMNRNDLKSKKLTVPQLYDSYVALNKNNDILSNRLIKLFDEDYKSAFDYLINQEKIIN